MIFEIILTLIQILIVGIFIYFLNKQKWRRSISKNRRNPLIWLGLIIGLLLYFLRIIVIFPSYSLFRFNWSVLVPYLIEAALMGVLVMLLFLKEVRNKIFIGAIVGLIVSYGISLMLSFRISSIAFILLGALIGFIMKKIGRSKHEGDKNAY